jgi:hypothetical protein
MLNLIAKKRLTYAGKPYAVGDPFSASAADARILTVTGLASLAEAEAPPALVAEARTKRQYRRRDMRADA